MAEPPGARHGSAALVRFESLDLAGLFNNRGATGRPDLAAGAFNVWGNSFPAGELPAPGAAFDVDGVPFVVQARPGAADNVRCEGQYVAVPPDRYDWLYLLAAGERRVEDEIALHYDGGGIDLAAVRISDFWAAPAAFGERPAARTRAMHYRRHVHRGVPATLWCQRLAITRPDTLAGAGLPANVALHVFAATLVQVSW